MKVQDKYPIAFRKEIEDQIDRLKSPKLILEPPKDKNVRITYRTKDLNFLFRLRDFKDLNGKIQCSVDRLPTNRENYLMTAVVCNSTTVGKVFKEWLDIVTEVADYKSILDYDKIYESYDKEFFEKNNFNATQSDNLLSLEAQIKTAEFLDNLLIELKESPNKDNKEISSVIIDIENLSDNIGSFNQGQVFKLIVRYLSVIRTHLFPTFRKLIAKIDISKTLELVEKGIDIYKQLTEG